MLIPNFSHASILGLNALLVESPSSLTEHFAAETVNLICQGVTHKDVRNSTLTSIRTKLTRTALYLR